MKIARRNFLLGSALAALLGHPSSLFAAAGDEAALRPQIFMFRGLFGIFSLGIDTLAGRLRERGYQPVILGWEQWSLAANQIVAGHRRGDTGHIILIGHSLGSDSTIQLASNLGPQQIPIDLIVTFDITQPLQVPANVEHLINFYQSNGVGRPAIAGPGFQGQLDNVDLSNDHSLDHLNIDKSEKLQLLVVNNVFNVTYQKTQQTAARRRGKVL